MVEVWLALGLIAVLLVFDIFLAFDSRKRIAESALEFQDGLEELRNSLNIVAAVLQQIPEMVPQFKLETSPLTTILEFFQTMKKGEPSYSDTQLRDDNGKFSHGEEKDTKTG